MKYYIIAIAISFFIGSYFANAAIPDYTYEPYSNTLNVKAALNMPTAKEMTAKFQAKYMSKTENTVVYFKMNGCQYCEQYSPVYDKVSKTYAKRAKFYTINVDESNNWMYARILGIRGYPTTIIFPKSNIGEAYMGSYPEAKLINILEENLK